MRKILGGLGEIRKPIDLIRQRERRTEAGLFRELAVLKGEKERLTVEKGNWERKIRTIDARLDRIAVRERVLQEAAGNCEEDGGKGPLKAGSNPGLGDGGVAANEITIRY